MRKPNKQLIWPRGDLIKELIAGKGWSYADLSARSGIAERTIDKVVAGLEPVRGATLLPIAQALGVTLEDIGDKSPPVEHSVAASKAPTPLAIVSERAHDDRFSLSIRSWMAELNLKVERLNAGQHSVIERLQDCQRARISGCAGSGKTLVAAEKAARCSIAGLSTLFLCHSPKLADHVRGLLNSTRVKVEDFGEWVRQLGPSQTIAHASWSAYDEPDFLTLSGARDALLRNGPRYSVIVVDEGQDFRAEWWDVVESALRDAATGMLYVFHDDNQAFLRRGAAYPNVETVCDLSKNCRNSGRIFKAMSLIHPSPPTPEGDLIDVGEIRSFQYTRSTSKQMIKRALEWIVAEGFDGDTAATTNKLVALHGGTSPLTKSPLMGDYHFQAVDWQQAVRNEFERGITQAEGLVFPSGGTAEALRHLEELSEDEFPNPNDIKLVMGLARRYTVHPRIRGNINKKMVGRTGLKWVIQGKKASLGRAGVESFRASEIIIHFERPEWHRGLPKPTTLTLSLDDRGKRPGLIPVHSVADFKGLESGCILLFIEGASISPTPEVYIGISRARHLLAVLMDESSWASIPKPLSRLLDTYRG